MARVLAGQEHAPRWGADRSPGPVIAQPHALGSELVDIGRWDFLLALAPHLAPAQVIGQYEHHIGRLRGEGSEKQDWGENGHK